MLDRSWQRTLLVSLVRVLFQLAVLLFIFSQRREFARPKR
jgi:hypothetical protein